MRTDRMRFALVASAVACLGVVSVVLSGQDQATDVANRIVGNMTKAWNSHDGTAYAAEFWPDAEFVNVFGAIMKDQQYIATRTDEVVKGALRNRQVKMTIRRVRELAPTVIVVDSEDTDGSGASQVTTRMKLILQKRGDIWRVAAGQNTRLSTPTF